MARTDDSDPAARVNAERHAQGLGPVVIDPQVLRQVAGLLGGEDASARERRLAEVQRELTEFEVRFRLGEELS
jgi:hypothetical protein